MSRDNAKFSARDHYKVGSMPPRGYVAWHSWAEDQHKGGLRQKQCTRCGLWLFPQELAAHNGLDGLPCSSESEDG